MIAPDVVARVTAALDAAEEALTWTSSRGQWENRGTNTGDRKIKHRPSGDTLGEFTHPADARHAALWQPVRVQTLITSERILLDYATELAACGEPNSAVIARAIVRHLATRWEVQP